MKDGLSSALTTSCVVPLRCRASQCICVMVALLNIFYSFIQNLQIFSVVKCSLGNLSQYSMTLGYNIMGNHTE